MAHGVAVDVVPAREDDLALGAERGEPFRHVVPRELTNVRAVRLHPEERVRLPAVRVAVPEAAALRAASRGHERDVAVRQPARHEVFVHALRELREARAVHVHAPEMEVVVVAAALVDGHRERVKRTLRLDKREQRRTRIKGETRLKARSGRHPPCKDVTRGKRTSGALQNEQRAARTLTPAEVLRHAVVPARVAPRAEEYALLERRREARIGKQARAPRTARGEEIRPAFRRRVPLLLVLHPLSDHGDPEVGRHPVLRRESCRPRARGRLQPREPVAVKPMCDRHGTAQRDRRIRARERPRAIPVRPEHVATIAVFGIAVHHHNKRQQLGGRRQRVAEQTQVASHGVEARFGDGILRRRTPLPERTRVAGQLRRALRLGGGRPVERQ